MDFSLSQEQEMFREYIKKFLVDMERTKIARDYVDNKTEHVKNVISDLKELGWTKLNIPEEYEGMGLGQLDLVPIMEEFGRVLLPGLYLETNALAVPLLERFGTNKQKQLLLKSIADSDVNFTVAWLEPGGSYKEQGIQLTGEIIQDQIRLNGVKTQVPDVELAQHVLVPLRINNEITLISVDLQTPGLLVTPQKNFVETRKLFTIHFDNVTVPIENVIGQIGDGWGILQECLLYYNAALSSVAVGAMEQIVEMATEYAKIREQFGNPIGRFQAIKHRLADMKLDLETARSLSYYANWTLETSAEDRTEAICSARIFATEAFIRLASHNIQIHGGIGFTEEIDCHLFVKQARYYENYLGNIEQYYDLAIEALNWTNQKPAQAVQEQAIMAHK
ncbi:acyl-CoA dehydrogenase family protein [Solibacillus merdavium]|uniref:Acyl-CoA/acyl-ACP dehydrogenase n=1 Tax=Solibacillus merdavium TaxID=2762218 RepID=A0ABR8XN79_9BACL|nr:acyl-CoA dehydrogenase family protein [Solibacillus merdavium]MBD8033394.1 acyl-CoA/acyl-ACP dehydrogenase [Solibacillus merdavium]